ncbi:pH-response regulator protein palH/rim21 [Madurella fahalii]|uniref:PH-response regulator protein palH/rim21 n=1 Tax=Madurella fahalii TaxID=1157608 RepID=A0ABQ0GRQ9_9PEZI
MEARQLFAGVTATAAEPTSTPLLAVKGRSCGGLNLPVGGILSMPGGEIVTLTAAAGFKPVCTPITPPAIIANGGGGSVSIDNSVEGSMPTDDGGWTYSDFRDPFYASTFPQCYALAATTVVAYTLVIMLFVTPRSFLDGGVVVLGRKGFTDQGSGPSIGGRPWLQKVAALTVAISLTIASAATFQAAEEQYSFGIQNAKRLQMEVLGGNELKIIRIISNTFLWLAQAQTLIRLFPRQREKVIIKWTAFALITLDIIFQSLNSFQYTAETGASRPGSFQDAVPALSYLFALSLNVLYAAWVIYYSLMKKRYAFWHPQMRNMCLVATLSLLSILIPVVFFILDISKPEFTGWGEYVRWVGAAAASVIVWEWVERIEALEREEKRDGILGREVFDGDEMLEMTSSVAHLRRRRKGSGDGDKDMSIETKQNDSPNTSQGSRWHSVSSIRDRYNSRSKPRRRRAAKPTDPANTQPSNHDRIRFLQPPLWPARPPPAVTPISRTDTASAASTIYAVRYHPLTETTSRTTPPPAHNTVALTRSDSIALSRSSEDSSPSEGGDAVSQVTEVAPAPQSQDTTPSSPNRWRVLAQIIPFTRTCPPDEEHAISPAEENKSREKHSNGSSSSSSSTTTSGGGSKWDFRGRFEEFAVTQAERLREKFRPTPDTDSLPITVIPAPPRRGAALAQLLEEEEQLEAQRAATAFASAYSHGRRNSNTSRTLLQQPPGESRVGDDDDALATAQASTRQMTVATGYAQTVVVGTGMREGVKTGRRSLNYNNQQQQPSGNGAGAATP